MIGSESIANASILQDEVLRYVGKKGFNKLPIPPHITENLSRELRDYQVESLRYFLSYLEEYKNEETNQNKDKNHLLFNMATGSGKTLVMAALILYCYKEGYRNFVFFVNSRTILEKTKANFTMKHDSKYLFNEQIIIDSKPVEINPVDNLYECKEEAINIHFTTVQALCSLLKTEKENSFTINDFKDRKVVLLADEAHHLNANTKKSRNKGTNSDIDHNDFIESDWESVIKRVFKSCAENLLFEFTATIPNHGSVHEKYKNCLIYEYDLKKFCTDGYSKRIFVLKYESLDVEDRLLGGILMSLFRELLALKRNLGHFKPVVLFKSESISQSIKNQEIFLNLLENIEPGMIEAFYKNIKSDEGELFYKSFEFFKKEFGVNYASQLVNYLKANLKKSFILNTNSEEDLEKQQFLLNSLENPSNEVRVIFCVDKLNEGWDVLNLFDIVRLGNPKGSKATTTKEVQLIGRGARYYPFDISTHSELRHKRKFDIDRENTLGILECLGYHTINDTDFITKLNQEMAEKGLAQDYYEEIHLNLRENARKILEEHKFYYVNNKRIRLLDQGLLEMNKEIDRKMKALRVPLSSKTIQQTEENFTKRNEEGQQDTYNYVGKIPTIFFLKAMNQERLGFDELKRNFPDYSSKRAFVDNYLRKDLVIKFDSRQKFSDPHDCLGAAQFIIEEFKSIKESVKYDYEVTDFEIHEIDVERFKNRVIFIKKNSEESKIVAHDYNWLCYDKHLRDSGTEDEFLRFIKGQEESIDAHFDLWFVVRNDGFEEFKIYDYRKTKQEDQKSESTYGKGFEPDFIFFGKRRGEGYFIGMECFVEVKGSNSDDEDRWKEELLEHMRRIKFDKVIIESMPFFKDKDNSSFFEAFTSFLETGSSSNTKCIR